MTAADLRRAHDLFASVLAGVTEEQHGLPTPCASWDVRALIGHVLDGARLRVTRLGGVAAAGSSLEEAAAAEVAAFAVAADDQPVELPFGTIPASVFVDIAAGDVIVHAWDLATATGQPTDLDAELCDAVHERVASVLGDSFRGPDGQAPFGVRTEAPEGASAADRFAAFTGRTV
jgi:uncharacterized protein (TIGR03086 family)